MTLFQKLLERLRTLWKLALSERATPRELAQAVFMGVFVGCTPAIGFHGGIAVALATVFRLSRLWALIASRISNFLCLPWIVLAEVQVAHRARTGEWAPLDVRTAVDHAGELLVDWCIGTIPVGAALASIFGALAYALAKRRDRRRAESQATT